MYGEKAREEVRLRGGSGTPRRAIREELISMCGALVAEDGSMTVREFTNALQIAIGSVHTILYEVRFSRVCAKWVPKLLTKEQKEEREMVAKLCRTRFIVQILHLLTFNCIQNQKTDARNQI